ncbi:MAG: hypothetical protein ABI148_02215 [Ginsengibacter sp.]
MMKRIFTLLFLLFMNFGLFAQNLFSQGLSSERNTSRNKSSHKRSVNFDGQWKGAFNESTPGYLNFGGDNTEYVLELNTEGSNVSGYSYTYFTEGPKRYYTICRLTGTLSGETKDIIITEIERLKSNTPPNFGNCFQIHRLHYAKDTGNIEELRGTWIPVPNQGSGCGGTGTTVLSRRIINNLPTGFMPHKKNNIAKAPVKKPAPKNPLVVTNKKSTPSIARSNSQSNNKIQKAEKIKSSLPKNENSIADAEIKNQQLIIPTVKGFQSRRKDIVKTITIEHPTFNLSFYDNGEIDGDSITVFYNGKIVLSHQRLTDKPISLTLALDKNAPQNIITMYADNLGTIPPNTALMIVTDGNKRYEVRMESDTEKSGSVIFEPKE